MATNTPLTLSTAPLEHPAMDYAFLRQEGIRLFATMAGQTWTDFNAHDPGITILEQVCYALTDLAQRITYPLPDLLSSAGADAYSNMYDPVQILTTQPVTLEDLRKLVIDVEGVKNGWVEKVTEPTIPLFFDASNNVLTLQADALAREPVLLKGLYRVLLELADVLYLNANVQAETVRRAVVQRLQANRNLGEDFVEIRVLDPQYIQVQANIEIETIDDANMILLAIYQRLADHISPPVHFYSANQRLAAGKSVEEIYTGPLLEHGFIDDDELRLAQRRTALRTSDLIHEIMDVPGVRAVRTITISADDNKTYQDWSLDLDPSRTPKFNPAKSAIQLERNRLPATLEGDKASNTYNQQVRDYATAQKQTPAAPDLAPPRGRDRNLGNYYSLQYQFPAVYGIGAQGLPDSAPPPRKAQAQQLKAYLLFFDQLLANYFSQVAHLKDLFAFTGDRSQTYFAQAIDDPQLGLEGLRREPIDSHLNTLQRITENPYPATDATLLENNPHRHNRFLNHLLARFAEQLTDYSLLHGMSATPDGVTIEKLKQAFLQDYLPISRGRGIAFNYLQPQDVTNRSGLEKRIARKLGLVEKDKVLFYLVEHILLRPMAGDQQQQVDFLAAPAYPDPYSLQISFVFPNDVAPFDGDTFRTFTENTIREETPAHLVVDVYWRDQNQMKTFKSAYQDWLNTWRVYWTAQLGG